MYQVIVRLDPCPTELICQFLLCQALVSTQQSFQQATTFCIEASGYLHLPAFCIGIEGCPYTISRQLQHPADILCCYEMPSRPQYMGTQDFPLCKRIVHRLQRRRLQTSPDRPFRHRIFLCLDSSHPGNQFFRALEPGFCQLMTQQTDIGQHILNFVSRIFRS